MRRFITTVLIAYLCAISNSSAQQPPASCATKFIGSWTVRVIMTGQTYPLLVRPNGTAHITCPLCPSEGTWSCNGNTFISLNTSSSATLSPDGRTLTQSCCVTTRVGEPAVAAKPAQSGDAARPQLASAARPVSCEAIGKQAPAFKDCDSADFSLQAARAMREKYPRLATDQYKLAAAAAKRAGDSNLELTILREATETPPAKQP
jgi:hypothetical protein